MIRFRRTRQSADAITVSIVPEDSASPVHFRDEATAFDTLLRHDPRIERRDFMGVEGEVIAQSTDPRSETIQYMRVDGSQVKGYQIKRGGEDGDYVVGDAWYHDVNIHAKDLPLSIPAGSRLVAVRKQWIADDGAADDLSDPQYDGLIEVIDGCRIAVEVYEMMKPRKASKSILGRLGFGKRSR